MENIESTLPREARRNIFYHMLYSCIVYYPAQPKVCVDKIGSRPRGILCVDKIRSRPRGILCVDKIGSVPPEWRSLPAITFFPSRFWRPGRLSCYAPTLHTRAVDH